MIDEYVLEIQDFQYSTSFDNVMTMLTNAKEDIYSKGYDIIDFNVCEYPPPRIGTYIMLTGRKSNNFIKH